MRLNTKTKQRILQRWPGSRVVGNRVILRCGCVFSARQMADALNEKGLVN